MPQVDLSSVCAGAGAGTIAPDTDDQQPPPPQLDYAPESFFVSRDSELEWLDQNAYIERKNSGKGPTSNPNSMYGSSSSQQQQRQLKSSSKATILALPKPHQKTEPKNRRACRPPTIRLFPKRSDSTGRNKQSSALSEPSSPKVSCMGRVRSNRRNHSQPKPGSGDTKPIKKTKSGFWNNLRTLFKSRGDKIGCKGIEPDGEPVVPAPKRVARKTGTVSSEGVAVEPPGLGAMNRFASGRRSDAWAGEIENEVKSEPLDHRSPIWERRETEAPQDVGVHRDWQSVGPATV